MVTWVAVGEFFMFSVRTKTFIKVANSGNRCMRANNRLLNTVKFAVKCFVYVLEQSQKLLSVAFPGGE